LKKPPYTEITSLLSAGSVGSVVDRHRFDADPDPDFHIVGADPDSNPDLL
jgi:hypothetical protein